MPWCPNCKTEYREGFTHCADCGAELVPTLPDEAPEPETLDRPTEAVMLMHCPSTLEADATVALLQSFSIPCFAQPDKMCIRDRSYLRRPNSRCGTRRF